MKDFTAFALLMSGYTVLISLVRKVKRGKFGKAIRKC